MAGPVQPNLQENCSTDNSPRQFPTVTFKKPLPNLHLFHTWSINSFVLHLFNTTGPKTSILQQKFINPCPTAAFQRSVPVILLEDVRVAAAHRDFLRVQP